MRELGIFLRTSEKRKPVVYIAMWKRPRSREYKGFPYREEVELMSPRSWGYPPYWDGENRVVGSLCMVRKILSYRNMRGDHTRAHRIRQYPYSSIDVIHPLSMGMYPST